MHSVRICLYSCNAVGSEGAHCIREQTTGLQEIISADRHINVKLEVALRCGKTDGNVVCHYLKTNHSHRLALRGIDLAGHYRRAGLVFGNSYLSKTAARARGEPSDVVGYLHKVSGERLERAVYEHELVL